MTLRSLLPSVTTAPAGPGRTVRSRNTRTGSAVVGLATVALATGAPASAQLTPTDLPDALSAVEARNIGPAGMSGRVAAVAVSPADRNVIYVGSATGGVFKSGDGGIQWAPVFDEQEVLGIGSVAVSRSNPDIVWVGTGEGNPRNSAGVGYGIYRSLDGGETWEHMGLEESERIHRVIIHPTDPDVVWVAAMGPAWRDGGQRGVYRTTDGGESWERVLSANDRTGAADLVMDPQNPNKLFAALWEYRRWPWFFESGGPGSGLFVSHDGGETWERLGEDDGLPPGELGRIGLAIADSDPDVVYAAVEAERSELLRSDDGGRSFRTVNDEPGIVPRPFYYADLRVDPENENRLYSLHGRIQVSQDAGRTFSTVVPSRIIHGDVHELWIDPADPRHMIMGNDGGIGVTWDRGDSWRFVENLTLAQFYHLSVDMDFPFNVYGGLQDNGSWYGPSDVWESRGILNAHWRRVGGGDGFATMDDPSSERHGYSMSQQGNLYRFDKVTGERHTIQPVHPEGIDLRFNWNAALALDPHDSTSIYLGSQFVHRSRDHGASWQVLSPDLTTDDPEKQRQDVSGGLTLDATGAENHTTIVDISPSPHERGVIWVGTDDGNVQLTTDDGSTWTNFAHAFVELGVPAATWVPDVQPSAHDPATAYVVFEDHRRGNWETYLFRTTDYGESWERLPTGHVFGFAHDLEEDPHESNLLFLGTEFGLYVSLDRGESWTLWTSNGLAPAPVRESRVHPRDGDLAVGTHGRGVWIVDDIRPLRELAGTPGIADAAAHAFAPPPAYIHPTAEGIGYRSTGHAMWQGEMRPYGALLSYWVGEEDAGGATLTVRDDQGRLVRRLSGPGEPGVNRVVWDLRVGEEGEVTVPEGSEVLPGRYEVAVEAGAAESVASLEVRPDPRKAVSMEDRVARAEALATVHGYVSTVRDAARRIQEARDGVETVLEALDEDAVGGGDEGVAGEGTGVDELRTRLRALRDTLEGVSERLFSGPSCQGICGGDTPFGTVRSPLFRLGSTPGAPTPLERTMMEQAREAAVTIVEEVNRVLLDEVAPAREALLDAGYSPLPITAPVPGPGG